MFVVDINIKRIYFLFVLFAGSLRSLPKAVTYWGGRMVELTLWPWNW